MNTVKLIIKQKSKLTKNHARHKNVALKRIMRYAIKVTTSKPINNGRNEESGSNTGRSPIGNSCDA